MLVVYGVPGSPGASTTAIHVAAHWASSGREVLLIEADPAGGSMSRNMGIQFTPGAASFVASGSPVRKGDLIDHSQDVLFTNLHVMPCPSNPSSTQEIIESFAKRAEELRDVSENDMAVVIDAGRAAPGPFTERWTASAAGVAVVARGDSGSSMSSLESVAGILAVGSGGGRPANGCVVTIGKPLWSPDDFPQKCGLELCGTIEDSPETAVDMSVFLDKTKRKDKKWRSSLKAMAEQLLPVAAPEPSVQRRPAFAVAAAAPAPPAASDARPQPEVPAYQAPAVALPEVPAALGVPASQPEAPAYQSPAAVAQPEALAYQVPAAVAQPEAPAYQAPAPQPEVPAAYQTPSTPQPEAAQPYQAPSPPPQPHQAPTPQPETPVAYQPPASPEAPTAYPAPPPAYPPAAPTPPYLTPAPQPGAPTYQAPPAPAEPVYPQSPHSTPPAAPQIQQTPLPEPPPEPPDIPPSGSFRDLAARLHSQTGGPKKAPSAGRISS